MNKSIFKFQCMVLFMYKMNVNGGKKEYEKTY